MRIFYTVLFVAILCVIATLNFSEQAQLDPGQDGVPFCNFQEEPCRYNASWGQVNLTSSTNKVVSETEFQLFLDAIPGADFEIKSAFLQGRDMYMGKIPVFFNSQNESYRADIMLGACTESQMVWRLNINVMIKQAPQTLLFDFVSYQ
ncbi:hypothetical protein [Thalassotalea mangrovi]|uniref:Uncharacterized protein n=1 Tax=Thalassotalea mangrovi TaxID=2572245 RepID=A0A4U1B5U8_9GAMM|nr:hypothetical protein [Thalassotalea mangrovi]TKB45823.1 hypothetical protein E8M12_06140 [Thalassotalea mangrovi]